jgi:hypothetical protein
MRIRRLTERPELEAFQERFATISQERSEGAISGLVPLDYLERSKVFGVFQKGAMVGGYVLGTAAPMRVIERFIPPDAAVDWPPGFRPESCSELVCAWREPALSSARMTGVIAPLGFVQSLLTRSGHVLGVCQHVAIHRYYESLGGHCVWHGKSPTGLDTWVYAVSRRSRLAIVMGLVFLAGPQKWLASHRHR